MTKLCAVVLLGLGILTAASAVASTPEIDAAGGVNALALVAGALLVIRGRRRK